MSIIILNIFLYSQVPFDLLCSFILHAKRTGFVVEHDFIMATYLADRVIVLEGEPSIKTIANSPQSLLSGMNRFLELLGITFRRDPNNFRPRINKNNSVKVCNLFNITISHYIIILIMIIFHCIYLDYTYIGHRTETFRSILFPG